VPFGVPANTEPEYREFRAGDVRHSLADISKAQQFLGYQPSHTIADGIAQSMGWYQSHLKNSQMIDLDEK
jgi:UDP-N-acetylglucosamine 4-epimerase